MSSAKKILAAVLAVVVAVACIGCSRIMSMFEDEDMRRDVEAMVAAAIYCDIDSAYVYMDEYLGKAEFEAGFSEICFNVLDVYEYELELLSYNQHTNVSVDTRETIVMVEYKMTTNAGVFVISAAKTEPIRDFHSFHLIPYENTNYYSVGTLANMRGASAFQWIMLLVNVVILGFMAYAIVDCCRRNIKLKPLWIVIILVAAISIGVNYSPMGAQLQFGLSPISYTQFVTYGGGLRFIRFMIPIGLIVYFALRKKLTKAPAAPEADGEAADEAANE